MRVSMGLSFSANVTEEATTAVTARPTLFPMLLTVLNTPPASPCVWGRNTDVMTRLTTVKSTSAQIGEQAVAKKHKSNTTTQGSRRP